MQTVINKKSVSVLNTLIEINNDRIEGYHTAAKETEEYELKMLFSDLAQTSENCNKDLADEVNQMGGTPTEETRTTGKFFRVWMDVKAAITGKDRKAILNSCEYGEEVAVNTYEKVLEDDSEDLTEDQKSMVRHQHELIKADHDKVKSLHDALVDNN
jgi:uncharacterized protein (TIGR02284 family)